MKLIYRNRSIYNKVVYLYLCNIYIKIGGSCSTPLPIIVFVLVNEHQLKKFVSKFILKQSFGGGIPMFLLLDQIVKDFKTWLDDELNKEY